MTNFYEEAGFRIRELRISKKYTREELAELAEISPKFLYEIERGKKGFSADTLKRIANALSVSSEYVISGRDKYEIDADMIDTLQLFNNSQIKIVLRLLKLIHEMNLLENI